MHVYITYKISKKTTPWAKQADVQENVHTHVHLHVYIQYVYYSVRALTEALPCSDYTSFNVHVYMCTCVHVHVHVHAIGQDSSMHWVPQ